MRALPVRFYRTRLAAESTKLLAAMMCAQMGVMMMFSASGSTMGPPADIE